MMLARGQRTLSHNGKRMMMKMWCLDKKSESFYQVRAVCISSKEMWTAINGAHGTSTVVVNKVHGQMGTLMARRQCT